MACNNSYSMAVFLTVLILFSAANPLAHAQGGISLGFEISGRVCCTPHLNCHGGEDQGLPGVEVRVNITNNHGGVSASVGNVTNSDGLFDIYIGASDGVTVADLRVSSGLPIKTCGALSGINGSLFSLVKYVNTQKYPSGRVVVYGTPSGFVVNRD